MSLSKPPVSSSRRLPTTPTRVSAKKGWMVSLLSPKAKVLRRCFVSLLILCLICVSETASSQPYPTAASSSLGAITIAQTQQTDAPALAFSGGQLIATWIGSDDRGVHQDARTIIDQQLS